MYHVLGAQKNLIMETVLLNTQTYVLVENKEMNLALPPYLEVCITIIKIVLGDSRLDWEASLSMT